MKKDLLALALLGIVLLPLKGGAQEEKELPSQKTKEAIEKFKKAPAAVGQGLEALKEAGKAKLQAGKAQTSKQDTLISEVLELTGAKRQIQQIPDMVKGQVAQRQKETDPRVYASLEKIMADSYKADALYLAVADRFKEKFDEQRLSAVLQFARSPLARKMTELEVRAATPQGNQELQKFAAQLKDNPPVKQRLYLVQRLDEAAGATQLSIQLTLATIQGLGKAIDRTLPPEKGLKEGQLEQIVKDTRAQLEGPLKNNTLTTFLYTYRSVSDDELKQYIQFVESDSGKWFSKVLSDGYLYAMALAAERAGGQLGKTLSSAAGPETTRYSSAGKRDPFRPLSLRAKTSQRARENLSPLERYEIGQLKLVAIVWDIKEPKAMVEDAAGLGYIVKIGTLIGPNDGKVKAIKPAEVVIEESFTDFYGARKAQEISMKLPVE